MRYNPRMLTLARESRRWTQTELADKLKVRQGTVSKYESDDLEITDEAAAALSQELRYPVSFFEQRESVYPFGATSFYHRKQQSVTNPVLRKIEAKVNIYRLHIQQLSKATDLDMRNRFKRIDIDEHSGKIATIAGLIRAAWRIPAGPIANMVRLLEDAGAIVIRFDFETAKMFGLSEWIPPAPPIFFLNDHPEISADRDRFTLAHELGHVILHSLPNPNMENEANRFAAEFLMPAADIRPHLRPPVKLHSLARLKPHWKVSIGALAQRARDLGVINGNQFVYLRMQLQQNNYALREPPSLDIAREHPTLLLEIIKAHLNDLGYSYGDLAKMLHMELAEFRSYYRLDSGSSGLRIVAG
ncbi:MAG TPA: XRE family transcriptional regulator [Bryobacteraceae bacterium]|nr:XRE family transcriptional regulator [Bryobacteraceae bacterium]